MIEIQYRCAECESGWRVVSVRERSDDQAIIHWMRNRVVAAIGAHHAIYSPLCRAASITETKIPIDVDGRIGDPLKGQK